MGKTTIEPCQQGAINVPVIWNAKDLDIYEKSVLWSLLNCENKAQKHRERFYCTRKRSAENLGIAEKTFTKCIESLKSKGYIDYETVNRYNYYTINWDYLNQLANTSTNKEEKEEDYETVNFTAPQSVSSRPESRDIQESPKALNEQQEKALGFVKNIIAKTPGHLRSGYDNVPEVDLANVFLSILNCKHNGNSNYDQWRSNELPSIAPNQVNQLWISYMWSDIPGKKAN